MAATAPPIFRDKRTDAPLAAICVVNDIWWPSNGDPEFLVTGTLLSAHCGMSLENPERMTPQ
ncbi:hypothetical protein NTCA1_23210 [Novosphingobium sp. TCA1]|nr:hypothetical protein NTCA1_23210 [Novosphingobium sp. TCA1]